MLVYRLRVGEHVTLREGITVNVLKVEGGPAHRRVTIGIGHVSQSVGDHPITEMADGSATGPNAAGTTPHGRG
jgi:hypothetical protein